MTLKDNAYTVSMLNDVNFNHSKPSQSTKLLMVVCETLSILFADFAEALSNPLAWLTEQDRHQKQLEVFEEDDVVVGALLYSIRKY